MPGGRQHGDISGHFAQAEILHQAGAELAQRVFLILPIHWRAGINHVAQRRMIMRIHGGITTERIQNGRHGEHV